MLFPDTDLVPEKTLKSSRQIKKVTKTEKNRKKKEGEHPTFESKSLSISPLSLLLSLNDSYLFDSTGGLGKFLCYSSAIMARYQLYKGFC